MSKANRIESNKQKDEIKILTKGLNHLNQGLQATFKRLVDAEDRSEAIGQLAKLKDKDIKDKIKSNVTKKLDIEFKADLVDKQGLIETKTITSDSKILVSLANKKLPQMDSPRAIINVAALEPENQKIFKGKSKGFKVKDLKLEAHLVDIQVFGIYESPPAKIKDAPKEVEKSSS